MVFHKYNNAQQHILIDILYIPDCGHQIRVIEYSPFPLEYL